MIKDVVVNLSVGPTRDVTADYSISVAETFGSHLTAVAFVFDQVMPPTTMGGIPTAFVEAQRAAIEKSARAVIAKFEDAARLSRLSVESHMVEASFAGASETFGRIARRFDLSIVGQAEPNTVTPQDLIIEAALFESGRPVLVVPYIQRTGLKLDRVLVCWNASRNAARAITDAMPFLARARSIEVVVVTAGGKTDQDELPGADIALHLARHGLQIELKRIVASDVDIANTLLSHAADASADFIVMGGYGHSRLREFVLGGATRGILSSMTVPALMSH